MLKSITFVSVLVAGINAAPTLLKSAKLTPRVDYTQFNGDGSTNDGWPSINDWQPWDDLWQINSAVMATSCGYHAGWGADDSSTEIGYIQEAIQNIAGANNVDQRFVLAIMMEESQGCVRVPSTNSHDGVFNPGLMQSHSGPGTCAGVDPCPQSEINQMITDGVAGTSAGAGLAGCLADVNESGAQGYYAAAREYNSGTVDKSDLSQSYGSNTPNYPSDIANRLLGWHN